MGIWSGSIPLLCFLCLLPKITCERFANSNCKGISIYLRYKTNPNSLEGKPFYLLGGHFGRALPHPHRRLEEFQGDQDRAFS